MTYIIKMKLLHSFFPFPKAEEYGYMVAFTSAFEVLGIFEISHGSINFSLLSPREIMIRAILSGANGVVIMHNHPSGSLEPSKDDIRTFEQIKEAFNILNIALHDFIIIGDDSVLGFLSTKITLFYIYIF